MPIDQSSERALFADLMGLPTKDQYLELTVAPQRKRELTLAAFIRQIEARARQLAAYERRQ